MQKIITIVLLSLAFPAFSGFTLAADDKATCKRLNEKAGGEMTRYSLNAEVDGPVYFQDIGCGVRYRNKELCAMEMLRFDSSARVHDYYTSEEIDINKAFFWLDEKDPTAAVVAFDAKGAAEKYAAEKGCGIILDYGGLTQRMLK